MSDTWIEEYARGREDARKNKCELAMVTQQSKTSLSVTLTDDVVKHFAYVCGYAWIKNFRWLYFTSASYQGDRPEADRFEAYAVFDDEDYCNSRIDFNRCTYDLTYDSLMEMAAEELKQAKDRAAVMELVHIDTPPFLYRRVMTILDDMKDMKGKLDGAFSAEFQHGRKWFVNYNDGLILLDSREGRPIAVGPQALLLPW